MSATKYIVKKGPADPFRGDWYIHEAKFHTLEQAITKAAELTMTNYLEFKLSWEEFGYEWSVFVSENGVEKKLWEGYKYIKSSENGNYDIGLGLI